MQNLIGSFICFLILENCVNFSFFVDFNKHGYISKSFLGVMVALNAARNSLSFFMLLIVCLGYGVVYPTLGSKMYWAIGLTVLHFIFGSIYFTYSMLQNDANSFLIFVLGLPLAITLFVFYVWILLGIDSTVMYLQSKRQSVKLVMYKRLYNILVISVVLLFGIFVANGLNMFFRSSSFWVANQWKWRWLILEGALNTNYFIAFVAIAYIWMPTRNNCRLALEQVGSEDIDDIPGHDYEEMEMELKNDGMETTFFDDEDLVENLNC